MIQSKRGLTWCLLIIIFLIWVSSVFPQQLLISPESLYLGHIPEGKETIRGILLYNTSMNNLDISNLMIQGTDATNFSFDTDPGSVSIGPYQTSALMIKYKPGIAGNHNAHIVLESNSSTSPDQIELTGKGTKLTGGLITFERIIGSLESDGDGSVRVCDDGGFIIAGSTYNVDEDRNDALLIKTDSYGQVEWRQTYDGDDGEENSDGFSSVIIVSDGFIAVGSSDQGSSKNDIWVVKTDLNGNFLWHEFYGGSKDDGASVIEATSDGNFIIAGNTKSAGASQGRDGYLIKIDGQGNEIWNRTIGSSGGESFRSVKQTSDGGYILAGFQQPGTQQTDMYLVKTDGSGVVQWERNFGSSGSEDWEEANSVIVTENGGYLLAGWTSTMGAGARDLYVIKTDASGNKDNQWGDKTFGGEHHDGASEVIATSDGGYLVVGGTENHYEPPPLNEWYSDLYIIKLDANGTEQWNRIYGGIRGDGASCVRELDDGGFIISGNVNSYSRSRDTDIYLLRLTNQGKWTSVPQVKNIVKPGTYHLEQNYPNPFNNQTSFLYSIPKTENVQVAVYNISGQQVVMLVNEVQDKGTHAVRFDATNLPTGIYFYQMKTASYSEVKRMLLLK